MISQNTGELGWVIWLAIMVPGADDRLVIGRSHHRPRSRWGGRARQADDVPHAALLASLKAMLRC
jgi:hypothetical protein